MEPRKFTPEEWSKVRSIFESRGVSREVAGARPYVPYARGADWVTAEDGPYEQMFKKIMYSLGALAVLAMAVGAGFKPA